MLKTLAQALRAQGLSEEELVNVEARRRRLGGTLDTNLLELGLCTEREMNELLARSQGLPLPPPELAPVSEDAAKLFPRVLAERYGLAPLGIWEKRLALLVRHPIDLAAIDEISFLLSRPVRLFAGTELLQREILGVVYGVALPPRFARLRTRLERRRTWAKESAALAGTPAVVPAGVPTTDESKLIPGTPGDGSPGEAPSMTDWAAQYNPPARTVTVAETLEDLRTLSTRDAVVGAAMRFLLEAFEFVVFYSRRGSEMTVFEVSGVDFGGADVSHTGVSLSRPSSLRTVVEERASYIGPIPAGDALESSLGNLGRSRLRAVFLFPVVVRRRTVGVIYGDRGGEALAPSQLSDVTLVLSQLGAAFERILKEKGRQTPPPPEDPPRVQDDLPGTASLPSASPEPEDYRYLVRRFLAGDPEARMEAARRLAQGGKAAAEALAERFPGPLFVVRTAPEHLPAPEHIGPLVALLVGLGDEATPVLQELADHAKGERRFWAGALLAKMQRAQASVGALEAV